MNICRNNNDEGGYEMLIFKPKATVLTLLGHDVYGVHDTSNVVDNTVSAITKWVR